MTCGLAVKRPHDYEAYLGAESGVEAKRSRGANPHCSPFRPQLGTLATSLQQSTSVSAFAKQCEQANDEDAGPFSGLARKHQLNENQLESYLRAQVQHLKRRKLIPHRATAGSAAGRPGVGVSGHDVDATMRDVGYRRSALSPSSSHSGSDSDSESAAASSPTHAHRADGASSVSIIGGDPLYDRPQFSLKQVKLICERLLQEQEIRLRHEYQTALNKKLEEQHDQYVQFAKEQIDNQYKKTENDYSYFS